MFFVVVLLLLIFLLLVGRIGLFKLSSLLNFLFFNNDCVLISTKKKHKFLTNFINSTPKGYILDTLKRHTDSYDPQQDNMVLLY